MVLGIGYYIHTLTPTEAINGGIIRLTILDERGTGVSVVKSTDIWKKIPANYRIRVETHRIVGGENWYRPIRISFTLIEESEQPKSTEIERYSVGWYSFWLLGSIEIITNLMTGF